jgi:hypothetical protein
VCNYTCSCARLYMYLLVCAAILVLARVCNCKCTRLRVQMYYALYVNVLVVCP